MALQAHQITVDSCEHAVKFYEHDCELVAVVGPYLAKAAHNDEVAVVIATEAHRREFQRDLQARGIDLERAIADGGFFWLDAAAAMAEFIFDGQIDHGAFNDVIGGHLRRAAQAARPISAYGEMVALLWDAGEVLAAIELEELWNGLARELPFSLLCSYPAASVSGSEHADALHQVCHLHSAVLHPVSPGESAQRQVTGEFAAQRDSPRLARLLVAEALEDWGHDSTLVGDVVLVVSELASNAVLHAASSFSIEVTVQSSIVHVAVSDCMPMTKSALKAHPPHGLGLIDALCGDWGVASGSQGKTVWAQLPCGPSTQAGPPER
ncbi:MAG TPA: MEDS domain-containing protein [Solirubrobacteraceae bacterium]